MSTPPLVAAHLPIAAVERDTGLSKDTLRVWERRYGFPSPERDEHGERSYPPEQVERLRLIKRLLDQGRRPAALMKCCSEELTALLGAIPATELAPEQEARQLGALAILRRHAGAELRTLLHQRLLKEGLQRFVSETVAPLNAAVGEAWLRGELEVAEEHLYTEQVQNVLRSAIALQGSPGQRPRVLLTTLPDELHALGLLMVEAMLVAEGASCVSLGTQTPVRDICSIASGGAFDVVALSFSAAFPVRRAEAGAQELQTQLPPGIELWCGGGGLRGRQARLPGIIVIDDLAGCLESLHDWRRRAA